MARCAWGGERSRGEGESGKVGWEEGEDEEGGKRWPWRKERRGTPPPPDGAPEGTRTVVRGLFRTLRASDVFCAI